MTIRYWHIFTWMEFHWVSSIHQVLTYNESKIDCQFEKLIYTDTHLLCASLCIAKHIYIIALHKASLGVILILRNWNWGMKYCKLSIKMPEHQWEKVVTMNRRCLNDRCQNIIFFGLTLNVGFSILGGVRSISVFVILSCQIVICRSGPSLDSRIVRVSEKDCQ